jgi:glutamate/tyrosine decarboxylase-like PLP-dependent enzyme
MCVLQGLWPGLRRFETEVVAMVARMLNGDPETTVGVMTSGGTESILLAIKVHIKFCRFFSLF